MSKTNKGGRPAKYPYELLFEKLSEYALDNKMGQITNSKLHKATGIPAYVWRDNKTIQDDIKRLNGPLLVAPNEGTEITELPNIVNLVEKYYGNKAKLIEHLRFYMDYIDNMNSKAVKYDKLTKKLEKLESENSRLKLEKKKLEEANESYKVLLQEYAVDSTSLRKRKEFKIEKNVLSIEDNISRACSGGSQIESEFSGLFGDI
ncbi:hypothetical protein ACV3UL_15590 [Clostridium perfringens]